MPENLTEEQCILRRYLDRFRKISARIRCLEKELEELEADAALMAAEELKDSVNDMRQTVQCELAVAIAQRVEIREMIALLPENSYERIVLSAKYIARMSETDICEMIPCDRSTYYRIVARGIDQLLEFKSIMAAVEAFRAEIAGQQNKNTKNTQT